jgi:signal transduction histidine kinase
MNHSFRLRIALFSALLSGLVLTAFGSTTWWLIRGGKIERMDNDARAEAERETQRTRDAAEWQRTEARMAAETGIRDSRDFLLLVEDGAGKVIYHTSDWPEGLDVTRLPWPPIPAGPRGSEPPPRLDSDASGAGRPPKPPPPPPQERPEVAPPGPPPASRAIEQTVGGRHWHIGLAATEHSRIAVVIDAAGVNSDMKGIFSAFLVALPLCLVLIGFGGWTLSGRALHPLRKLTAAARRVTAEGLDQRISSHGEDVEFAELIEVFNGMLERLERSFKQSYRFSADAAHELKTPLAILQGQIEQAIHAAEDGSTIQAELTGILDEVRRLSTISSKLLLLSQADAGNLKIHAEPFDLSRALRDLLEDTAMLAPHLLVTGDIQPGLTINADASLLPQVLHNLISNAIKYNVDHGWIRISAALQPKQIEVQVANSSQGIPPAERDRVFDRFFRADPTRSRKVEGVGLGLSVSREIARAHGGDIAFNVDNENVVQFSLFLPTNLNSGLIPEMSSAEK